MALSYADIMELLRRATERAVTRIEPHVIYADAPGDDPLEARKFEFWEVARGFGVTWDRFEEDWAEYCARKRREAGGE